MDIYYSSTSKFQPVPWSIVNISKIIVTILTVILDVIVILEHAFWKDEDKEVYGVDWVAPGLKIATYVSVADLNLKTVKNVFLTLPHFLIVNRFFT